MWINKYVTSMLISFLMLGLGAVHAKDYASMDFSGLTVRVLSRPGPVISGAIDMRGKKFKELQD